MARGDHLYVEDRLHGIPFQHHGIDMGDGTVIHLAPVDGARLSWRDGSQRFVVRCDSLEFFAGGRVVKIRVHSPPRHADQIVADAASMLGKSGYNLLEDNCEHFATRCATGRSSSQQVEMSLAALSSLASAATKAAWSISVKLGIQTAARGATRIHPAALLADGVEIVALAISCRQGMDIDRAKRVAKVSGNVAAVGIGAIMGGPVGAAAGLVAHSSSRAIAVKACSTMQRLLS